MIALLVAFAVLFGSALAVMCLIRLTAGILFRVRARILATMVLSPIGYLVLAIVVALLIAWLVQRTAFIKNDTLFWDGDNERTIIGMSMRHMLLIMFTILPTTLFDALLVSRGRQPVVDTALRNGLSIRSGLGWMCLIAANCVLPLSIVVAGDLIRSMVYGGY